VYTKKRKESRGNKKKDEVAETTPSILERLKGAPQTKEVLH
jgi:hypothetical protein